LIGDDRRLVKEIIDAKDGDAHNIMKQTELNVDGCSKGNPRYT
jgi:hypothetical protein